MEEEEKLKARDIHTLPNDIFSDGIFGGLGQIMYEISESHKKIKDSNNETQGFNRTQFRELLHQGFDLTEDLLMDRIFKTFDTNNDGLVDDSEWVAGLAVFLRGNLAEKINYTFSVYDMNSDGFISKDEIFQLLKPCQVRQNPEEEPDESVKDLVEIALKKMDLDKDGKLSLADFKTSIENEPLLIEVFGPCLPEEEKVEDFENIMFNDLRNKSRITGFLDV